MKSFLNSDFPWTRVVILLCLVTFLSGCGGSWNPFKKDDELAEAKTVKSLEVPPDLVKPETNQQFLPPEQQAGAVQEAVSQAQLQTKISGRVAPRWQGVQRMRDGQQYWLVVNASPEQVWPLIGKFLKGRDYSIAQNEPAIGILQTEWMESNDAGVGLRESLRVRVEPHRESGRTEVFLRVKSSEMGASGQWQHAIADDERSIEMLNRLARHLGANKIDDTLPTAPAKTEATTSAVTADSVKAEIAAEKEAEKQETEDRWKRIEKDCAFCPTTSSRVPK